MFRKLFNQRMSANKNKESNDKEQNQEDSIEQPIQSEAEHINKEEIEEDETSKLQSENEELKDKYLRLYSDFENYKRRTNKERIEMFKMAGQEILKSLIPVIDDFDRAEKSFETSTDSASLSEGLKLVSHKFKTALEVQGLIAYKTIGEDFDADLHEAITKIPAPSEELKGKVVDEIEKGYKLNDKVIRFAKVVVGE